MARPDFVPEQEIRFAVVMYGGVSLAIYINGVVQELLRLVRATAPEVELPQAPEGQRAYFDGQADLKGSERVYRKLGQLLPALGGDAAADDPAADAPIRTRFVVDILSGSSAGGINAIFLAKAIANQQGIDGLRNLWIHEGDIAELLNDRHAAKPARGAPPQKPPHSLLNSGRLYVRAWEALRGMAATEERREDKYSPAYAEELDLAVTTTDLQGLKLPIQLYDRVVYESRHRNVLKFVYAGPRATGEQRNDFGPDNDELLAFAARCTSAFPFAFEPAVPRATPQPEAPIDFDRWNPFFADYVARNAQWPDYAFADGGYLDNKPFSYATDALRRRRADVPVERKLLYIEPDPSGEPVAPGGPPEGADAPKPPPDVIANVAAAASLPRQETIREDIRAIVDRNRNVRRIRRLTLDLRELVLSERDPLAPLHRLQRDADDAAVLDALRCPQLMYVPYRRLRVDMVLDDLAGALVRLWGGHEESDDVEAARILLRPAVARESRGRERAFLADFDVRFRLRRLAFVQDRINVRLAEERRRRDGRRMTELELELRSVKQDLNDVFMHIRLVTRLARSREHRPDRVERRERPVRRETPDEAIAELHELARDVRPDRSAIDEILARGDAGDVPAPGPDDPLVRLLSVARGILSPVLADADGWVPGRMSDGIPDELREYYLRFESFDMVTLPLTYPGLEEVNPVDVVRIAPEDATSIISEGEEARRKLAGTSLGHFGGFMDAMWRRNDLMWGRLDAAERILDALLPAGPARDRLRDEAHAAIIREELVDTDAGPLTDLLAGAVSADDTASSALLETLHDDDVPADGRTALAAGLRAVPDAELLAHFKATYEVPRRLDPQATLNVAGRSATITGSLLEQASKARSLPAKPGFWLARAGRLLWGVVEVAVPGGRRTTLRALVFRHWTVIAMLLGAILVLVGALGVQAAQRVGWIVLLGAIALRFVVWLAAAAMTEAPVATVQETEARARVEAAQHRLAAVLAAKATAVGTTPRLVRTLWRHGPWALLAIGIALVVAGIWLVALQIAGWVLIGLALLAWLVRWARAAPYQRRLRAVAAVALVLLLALAGLELGAHGGDDVSSVVAKLPGSRDTSVEHGVRWTWDRLWPWEHDDGGTDTQPPKGTVAAVPAR